MMNSGSHKTARCEANTVPTPTLILVILSIFLSVITSCSSGMITAVDGPSNDSRSSNTNITATVTINDTASTTSSTSWTCKYPTRIWGDVNPNIFYTCDREKMEPQLWHCPEGRGFFDGLGHLGCIPYEEWPACISRTQESLLQVCDSEHLTEPWPAVNPNKFYTCHEKTTEALLLTCETGRGFVSAPSGQRGESRIVGCAVWDKWREYMQCEDYY